MVTQRVSWCSVPFCVYFSSPFCLCIVNTILIIQKCAILAFDGLAGAEEENVYAQWTIDIETWYMCVYTHSTSVYLLSFGPQNDYNRIKPWYKNYNAASQPTAYISPLPHSPCLTYPFATCQMGRTGDRGEGSCTSAWMLRALMVKTSILNYLETQLSGSAVNEEIIVFNISPSKHLATAFWTSCCHTILLNSQRRAGRFRTEPDVSILRPEWLGVGCAIALHLFHYLSLLLISQDFTGSPSMLQSTCILRCYALMLIAQSQTGSGDSI